MEDLNAHAERFGKLFRAVGRDHELLHVDGVVGVRAAVDDVHHRDGQRGSGGAAEVAVERRTLRNRGGARGRHGNGEDGIRAEPSFVARAVQRDHDAVDFGLVRGILAVQRSGDLAIDVAGRLQRAFAEVTRLVAVPQFHRFVLAGGCSGRHSRPSHTSVGEVNVRFDRRVAPRIENLSSNDFYYRRQRLLLNCGCRRRQNRALSQPARTRRDHCLACLAGAWPAAIKLLLQFRLR